MRVLLARYAGLSSVLVCLLLLSIEGCGGDRYEAQVSAFLNEDHPIASGATYVVLPGRDIQEDPEFKQYRKMAERKLDSLGYKKADFANADIAVLLSYAVDSGRTHQYAQSTPVYGNKGGGTSTVQGMNLSTGQLYTGTVQTPSTYGVVGSKTEVGTYVEYTRTLKMDTFDLTILRSTKNPEQMWKAEVTSVGSSNDLRRVMPVLIETGLRHFGQDTKRQIEYTLRENDENIRTLRGEKPE
jgi:hypothetical protein